MKLERILHSSLALSVAGFLGLLVYTMQHSIDYGVEAEYGRDLRKLQALDASLNERVLKARSGLLPQYDPLVQNLRELKRLNTRLKEVPEYLDANAELDLRSQIAETEAATREKDELVEGFKTHNAVLKNSLHYFPVISSSVIDRTAPLPEGVDLASKIQTLVGAIMLFDIAPETEAMSRVLAAQQGIEAKLDAFAALGLKRDVEVLLTHSRIILERKPIVDAIVHRILSVPIGRDAVHLEEAYSLHYRAAMDASLARRQILFGLALAMVVLGLTEVILRIRRSASALEQATRELRSANDALAKEREKERQLGELKTRFVSMTSHEFRTPLSAILSSAEMLETYGDRWDPERRMDHLERIRSAAGSMTRMLDDILVIGRAEAGVLRPSPVRMRLDDFCQRLVETLSHSSANSHQIRYSWNGDPQVALDERLLSHVLGNLLANAIKYSPPGSEVHFEVEALNDHCRFFVKDQGIGIPAEDIPRLFESFYRASNVSHMKGSGLGLAVVKRAVEVQGGSIQIQSELGRGTEISVNIPRDLSKYDLRGTSV